MAVRVSRVKCPFTKHLVDIFEFFTFKMATTFEASRQAFLLLFYPTLPVSMSSYTE